MTREQEFKLIHHNISTASRVAFKGGKGRVFFPIPNSDRWEEVWITPTDALHLVARLMDAVWNDPKFDWATTPIGSREALITLLKRIAPKTLRWVGPRPDGSVAWLAENGLGEPMTADPLPEGLFKRRLPLRRGSYGPPRPPLDAFINANAIRLPGDVHLALATARGFTEPDRVEFTDLWAKENGYGRFLYTGDEPGQDFFASLATLAELIELEASSLAKARV